MLGVQVDQPAATAATTTTAPAAGRRTGSSGADERDVDLRTIGQDCRQV
jgi:hypothetical protein